MPPRPAPAPPAKPARDPSMLGVASVGVLLLAVLAGSWVVWFAPLFQRLGMIPWRYAESFNNGMCEKVEGLEACEKIVWHSPTETLYLACSSLPSRLSWTPSMDKLDSSSRSSQDSFYTYTPSTGAVQKLTIEGYPYMGMGISMHGFSIVPSEEDPDLLWVYAVNHRIPREGGARQKGADSVIEVLSLRQGEDTVRWVRTLEDGGQVLRTPNDVWGGGTGEWVYFTNDYGEKLGLSRVAARLGLPYGAGSVGYCHVNEGCKIAAPQIPGANGIARGRDGKIWVAASFAGEMRAYEEEELGRLREVARVVTDRFEDDLSVDSNGDVFVATMPRATDWKHHFESGGKGRAPSTVHRIYPNQTAANDPKAENPYAIELFFADDGRLANAITSVEHWAEGRMLFLHGHIARWLLVCRY